MTAVPSLDSHLVVSDVVVTAIPSSRGTLRLRRLPRDGRPRTCSDADLRFGNSLLGKKFESHSACRATFLIPLATIGSVISNRLPTAETVGHPPVMPCELPDGIQLVYADDRGCRHAIVLDDACTVDFGRTRLCVTVPPLRSVRRTRKPHRSDPDLPLRRSTRLHCY